MSQSRSRGKVQPPRSEQAGPRPQASGEGRVVVARDPSRTPLLGLVLGYGAIVPLVAGAIVAWFATGLIEALAVNLSVLWGGAILVFLAGVRRGVSFRTPGGPTRSQILAMLWLFVVGFAAILSITVPVLPVAVGPHVLAFSLLLAGFLSLIVLDPAAAQTGEAPSFLARLRPVQMSIAAAAVAALLLRMT